MEIGVVINQMIVLFFLIGVGYIISKRGLADFNTQGVITSLILNVTAPAMMLSSVTGGQAKGSAMDVFMVFLIGIIMYLILPITGLILVKILKVPEKQKKLFIFMATFSNIGFMGFPVIRSIFGEAGVFFTAIFNMIFNILSFSFGMAMMSGRPISKRIMDYINPGVVSAFITIALFFLKIPFHPALHQGIKTLGDATTPLAMVVIGISLSRIPLSSIFKDGRIMLFTVIKQVIIPIIALFALSPFIKDPLILGVTIVVIAMPVATNCVLFATKFNNDVEAATRGVFITTLTSLVTIPIITVLLH